MGLFSKKPSSADSGLSAQSHPTPRPDAGSFPPVEVRATEGPMPETREQFKVIRANGGSSVDVVLIDTSQASDEELLELIEAEIHDLAKECGLGVGVITRRR